MTSLCLFVVLLSKASVNIPTVCKAGLNCLSAGSMRNVPFLLGAPIPFNVRPANK